MPELAGRVADAFEARVREHEERGCRRSPFALMGHAGARARTKSAACARRSSATAIGSSIRRLPPLKGKTQVFIDPDGDHFRTRMTHTLETSAIARGVARALRLNEDLTESIGLGHDMGHPPFGHAGEEALDECCASGSKPVSATTSSRYGSPSRST